jgi:hypothetical protein
LARRPFLDYPNDWSDDFLALSRNESGYDPALGFVRERGILRHTGALRLSPRPGVLGIRRLNLKSLEWDVTNHLDGSLSHSSFEVRPLGAEFESGDAFAVNLQRAVDVPDLAFEIFPGSTIPAGRYQFDRAEVQLTTSPCHHRPRIHRAIGPPRRRQLHGAGSSPAIRRRRHSPIQHHSVSPVGKPERPYHGQRAGTLDSPT